MDNKLESRSRRKSFVLACLVWIFCHGSVLADPYQTYPDVGGDFPEGHVQAVDGSDYTAVFGAGNADNIGNDPINFNNWTIGSFGARAKLSATTTATATDAYATVFGAGHAESTGTGNTNFFSWKIGNFGAHAILSATATATATDAYATVFGAGHAENTDTGITNFFGWTIGSFEAGARLTATATATTAYTAVFGAGHAENTGNGTTDFSHWTIGNFGANAILSANGGSYATVFGAGKANNAYFFGWTIGNFGDNANLSATATATAATSAYTAVFGVGNTESTSDFQYWKIGNFGADVKLSATATATAADAYAHTAIFGEGNADDTSDFKNWTVGNFGARANLSATATATATATDAHAHTAVFGAGNAYNANFSGWQVGNFGDSANLSATATATATNAHAYAYAAVFGVGNAHNATNFNNWTIGNFGADAKLSANVTSTNSRAAIFGAGYADNANFSGWTIGSFEPGARLTANATATADATAYAAVFGAADANSTTVNVSDWTAEFRGNATISAAGYQSDPDNMYIGTLGGDRNDHMRFYFNNSSNNGDGTVVNIAALKLGSVVTTTGEEPKQATMVLSADQGQNSATNYARAIAIGPNFQLNIGRARTLMDSDLKQEGATLETADSIASGGQPSGGSGTLNIFGAIGKARMSDTPTDSIIRIDSGWTVNAYAPAEDVASIAVNNGTFNTYSSIKDITLSNGEVYAYGTSDGIGTITLNGGSLHIARCDDTNFDGNFATLQSGMYYIDTDENRTKYGAGEPNTLIIDDTDYPWKGGTGTGQLTLNANDILKFHVDSGKVDSAIAVQLPSTDDEFELAKGYVTIDAGIGNAITFNGGEFAIVNEDASSPGTLPAHADFWLVRSTANTDITAVAAELGFNLSASDNFTKIDDNLYKLTDTYEDTIFSKTIDPYANWDEPLDVFVFNDVTNNASGLFVGTGETPHYAIVSDYTKQHANGELAILTVAAQALLSNAILDRLTSVKGCLDDPFIHALYSHSHKDEIAGFGYKNNMGGFVLGADNMWDFPNERYFRLGAVFGYVHGKTDFFGSATGLGKSSKQDFYAIELFGAYEFFNDKLLKTNVGITLGYGHSSDRLHRMDADSNTFDGKMRSNNIFVGVEFVKNLHAYDGYQFGLWLRGNYSHIAQKGYDETTTAAVGAQHVSAVNHNILTSVVGLNVEKEISDPDHDDKRWLLSLKAGWECQPIRKISDATVTFDNNLGIGTFVPSFGYPSKHAAIGTLTVSKDLNVNWAIVGSYTGRFSKDISTHTLSCGAQYFF